MSTRHNGSFILSLSTVDTGILALIAGVLAYLFAGVIPALVGFWDNPDYSHAYIVPLLMVWLWWRERSAAHAAMGGGTGYSLFFLVVAVFFYVLGAFGGIQSFLFISLWACLTALLAVLYGNAGFRVLWLVPVVGVFALPWPAFIFRTVSFQLRVLSSVLAEYMLWLVSVPVYRDGNIIDFGPVQLEVVDACSGLRYLLPCLLMALLAGYLFLKRPLLRLLLVIVAIPVSMLSNSFRIMVTGILCKWFGPSMAEGFFHDFSGWLVYLVALASLYGILHVLKKFDAVQKNTVPAPNDLTAFTARRTRMAVIMLCVVGALCVVEARSHSHIAVAPLQSFSQFPLQIGEWHGSAQTLDAATIKSLGTTDYTNITFVHGPTQHIVYLLVSFYPQQTAGEAAHAPTSCLLGSGWSVLAKQDILPGGFRSFPIGQMVLQKSSVRLLSNYWFEQRGRLLSHELLNKVYLFYDSFVANRSDGALVRTELVLFPGETEADGQRILDEFARELRPVLAAFIPGKDLKQ